MESILLALIGVGKRECVRDAERESERQINEKVVVPSLCSSERKRGDTENRASVASTLESVEYV